jgi:predicted ATPase
MAAQVSEGARFVTLATITNPDQVIGAIVEGLQVKGGGDRFELLAQHFGERNLLLVLDNFEQVVRAAPDVSRLLIRCRNLVMIVSSRLPLRIDGEQEFPVRPLAVPERIVPRSLDVLAGVPAVELFVQRARAVRPGFALTAHNASAVVELCRRLDGLPLAIELAAARIRLFSPQAILERLANRLSLLAGGGPDRPERLQTMRAAIDWSYNLLEPAERSLFRWLSVFVGGCTLDAAEALVALHADASPDGTPASTVEAGDFVMDLLSRLVDHSLLQQEELPLGDIRLGMLETIRDYGHERLVAAGERDSVRAAHARYFLAFARSCREQLEGPARRTAHLLVRRDLENLRIALAWFRERNEADLAQQLAAELARFWIAFGLLDEGRDAIERVLALGGETSHQDRFDVLYWASILTTLQDDRPRAQELAEAALAEARLLDSQPAIGMALAHLGDVVSDSDLDRAQALVEESLAIFRDRKEPFREATAYRQLALIAHRREDYELAVRHHTVALGLWQTLEHPWGVPISLRGLAEAALARGDLATARRRYQESIARWRELGERVHLSDCLFGLAQVNAQSGNVDRAALLLGTQDTMDQAMGYVHLKSAHDALIATIRGQVGEAVFAAAWAEGQSRPLDTVLDEELAWPVGGDPVPYYSTVQKGSGS